MSEEEETSDVDMRESRDPDELESRDSEDCTYGTKEENPEEGEGN